ncbi:MAG: hypothetical protein MUP76_11265, partial [Acidimicrobiia bacterium]|nr:hypothetical protein [Acidimicrobiia bacterium]
AAMRAAVDSRVFPLYEVRDGLEFTITRWPEHDLEPEAYFGMQGRFRPLMEDAALLDRVRGLIDRQWDTLVAKHRANHPEPATAG